LSTERLHCQLPSEHSNTSRHATTPVEISFGQNLQLPLFKATLRTLVHRAR
jgi:hypothetical protein